MSDQKKQSIGGLWINTSAKGDEYLSGDIEGRKVIIFKNTWKKEGEKTPDWRIYEKDEMPTKAQPQGEEKQRDKYDDGVPF